MTQETKHEKLAVAVGTNGADCDSCPAVAEFVCPHFHCDEAFCRDCYRKRGPFLVEHDICRRCALGA